MESVRAACSEAAVTLGNAIREAVYSLPHDKRTEFASSLLKPSPEVSAYPDVIGEQLAVQHLQKLSGAISCPIHLVIDPTSGAYLNINEGDYILVSASTAASTPAALPVEAPSSTCKHPSAEPIGLRQSAVWAYLDAVDGTLKLSGLFNHKANDDCQQTVAGDEHQHQHKLRVVNDGSWAVGIAFTDPTSTALQQLRLCDFTTAVIVDGNPPQHKCYPTAVVAIRASCQQPQEAAAAAAAAGSGGGAHGSSSSSSNDSSCTYQTLENPSGCRLFTSSCTKLPHCFAYLDCFQAHDTNTANRQDAELAAAMHRLLMDRHHGGAFDVLRQYGNLSSLLRSMLGWRGHEEWCEAQCGLFVVVNENLANLIPAVPIILGAGGIATDLEGTPLLERRLGQGRTSVVYAANAAIHAAALQLVDRAKQAVWKGHE